MLQQENQSEEMEKQIETAFVRMAACFPEPTKAKESFYKLNQIKDNTIFNSLELLLDQLTIVEAQATRVSSLPFVYFLADILVELYFFSGFLLLLFLLFDLEYLFTIRYARLDVRWMVCYWDLQLLFSLVDS